MIWCIKTKAVPLQVKLSPVGGKYYGSPPRKGGLFFSMEKQRVIVYVDGFNFYYGLKKERTWRRD